MEYTNKIFEFRKVNNEKLLSYGFQSKNEKYFFSKDILDDSFRIEIIYDNKFDLKVFDLSTHEEYTLAYVKDAIGGFVGKVRNFYETIFEDICEKCTEIEVFKTNSAKLVIEYIKNKYNAKAEYLWDKFPCNAVFREPKSKKWFAIIMVINAKKIGLKTDETIEVMDVKAEKKTIDKLIDNKSFFAGYHMNKNSWLTIILNEETNIERVYSLIDESYKLI